MIELNEEQGQELNQSGPTCVRDPRTNELYVLVKSEVYECIKRLVEEEEWAEGAYRASLEVFGRDDWNDPRMDVYDELDPRRQL